MCIDGRVGLWVLWQSLGRSRNSAPREPRADASLAVELFGVCVRERSFLLYGRFYVRDR